jgi:hypothetical protein
LEQSASKTLSLTSLCRFAEWHYAECHVLLMVKLNVIMLSVIMLSVVMLRVVALLLLYETFVTDTTRNLILCIIKRVALFKLSLLLKNYLQRTQIFQLILIGNYIQ